MNNDKTINKRLSKITNITQVDLEKLDDIRETILLLNLLSLYESGDRLDIKLTKGIIISVCPDTGESSLKLTSDFRKKIKDVIDNQTNYFDEKLLSKLDSKYSFALEIDDLW